MTTSQPHPALRWLSLLLFIARILLAALIVVVLLIGGFAGLRGASMSVSGTVEAPFTVDLGDGSSLVGNGSSWSYTNCSDEPEACGEDLAVTPAVSADLAIQDGDLVSRLIVLASLAMWLGAAWIGLRALNAIVAAALDGQPFAAENPGRLRTLGVAVLAVPCISFLQEHALNATLETTIPFHVALGPRHWLSVVLICLCIFALAEVFAEGARLREFEEATI